MCTDCRTLEVEMDAQKQRRAKRDAVSVHPDANVKRLTP